MRRKKASVRSGMLLRLLVLLYLPYLIPFVLFVFPSGLIAAGFQAPWGAVAQTAASLLTGLFHITVSPYITLALACYAEPLYLAGKGRRPS